MKRKIIAALLAVFLLFSLSGCSLIGLAIVAADIRAAQNSGRKDDDPPAPADPGPGAEPLQPDMPEPEPDPEPGEAAPWGQIGSLSITVERESGGMSIDRPSWKSEKPMGEKGVWTIFVYLCGTDLESDGGLATVDLNEMLYAGTGETVRFVVQTGGARRWRNSLIGAQAPERYVVANGSIEPAGSAEPGSMGDPETLSDFLIWGLDHYASEHMGVILWDHGGGSIAGVCFDERYDNDSLTLPELDEAFSAAARQMSCKFDFIGFDACLMGTIETANILASYAKYMIGSEESEPGTGWDYEALGTYLASHPGADGREAGKAICDGFLRSCKRMRDDALVTLSLIDLSKLDALLLAFNDFAGAMYEAGADETLLSEMVRGIGEADNFGGNNKTEGYTNMVDLAGLVSACAGYADGAQAVLDALDDAVVYAVSGSLHKGAGGLATYYPLCVQGSQELSLFSDICVSPFYLSFVDRQNQASVNGGDIWDYDGGSVFDEEGLWNWDSGILEEHWDYADEYAPTGESPLITFEEEPQLDEDGLYWFILDDSGWVYASAVYGYVFEVSYDGKDAIELGETFDIYADWETGFFCDDFDGYWLSLPDGQNLATYIVEYDEDFILYTSPIQLNGEETNLRLRQSVADGSVVVEGAWDGIDENGAAAREIYKLRDGDVIVPRYYAYSLETYEELIYIGMEFTVQGEPEITYGLLETGEYLYAFCIDDMFGDYYMTDYVTFGVEEDGSLYFY